MVRLALTTNLWSAEDSFLLPQGPLIHFSEANVTEDTPGSECIFHEDQGTF
jgi:hypothetical protein